VKQAVLGKARLVDGVGRAIKRVAVNVDLDQGRGGHFAEMQAIGIDQKGIVLARHLQRDMVENQLVPAEKGENPVTGREPLACLPFVFAAAGLDIDRGGHFLSPRIG